MTEGTQDAASTTGQPASAAKASGQAASKKAVLGDIVLVRLEGYRVSPAIITDVREDDSVDVQVFIGDHAQHLASSLQQASPDDDSSFGWYPKP